MKLKSEAVNLIDLHPKLAMVLPFIDQWSETYLGYEAIITSGCDGNHSQFSNHYKGCAVDLRTWTTAKSGRQIILPKKKELGVILSNILGNHFRVIVESTHIHVDFHPQEAVTWADM